MKFIFITTLVFIFSVFSVNLVAAHGNEGDTGGSMMMSRMMNMMHDNIDANKALNCDDLSDDEMMEHGEVMMEEMMGREAHESAEAAMTQDAHDNTHTMMGMWATGCVGDETMNTLMDRYGISRGMTEKPQAQAQAGWTVVGLGVIIGVVGGWMGSQMFGKKS